MNGKLFIDFETRSRADIKTAGADVYARDLSTDVLCLGVGADEKVGLWTPRQGAESIQPVLNHVAAGGEVVAHNAAFELAIWNWIGVRKYGWPVLRPEQVTCTLAMSYSMALPGALEHAAPAAGLNVQKDTAGHRVMLQVSQPKKIYPCACTSTDCLFCGNTGELVEWYEPETHPDKFQKLYAYCKQDVLVEMELYKRLLPLSESERELWLLDYKINQRGLQVDVPAARKALEIVDAEAERLNLEMREVTKDGVATCTAVRQLMDWLTFRGVEGVESVAKADVIELLARDNLPEDCRQALLLRQEAAKSSTKKLKTLLNGVCDDGRMRSLFQFCGAGATGRFAGRRFQPHNLPRPKLKQSFIEAIFEILEEVA